jgi:hypothetical protein
MLLRKKIMRNPPPVMNIQKVYQWKWTMPNLNRNIEQKENASEMNDYK